MLGNDAPTQQHKLLFAHILHVLHQASGEQEEGRKSVLYGLCRVQHYIRMTMQITSNLMLPNLLCVLEQQNERQTMTARAHTHIQRLHERIGKMYVA